MAQWYKKHQKRLPEQGQAAAEPDIILAVYLEGVLIAILLANEEAVATLGEVLHKGYNLIFCKKISLAILVLSPPW